jgi:hypothetical protein
VHDGRAHQFAPFSIDGACAYCSSLTCSPQLTTSPTPSVTQIVCPHGCVCQAVRAPGVKWTAAAPSGEASPGAAIVSM